MDVYVSSGEGTASQGDFHESLNWASREKAPVIFHIQNNKYAISVPIEEQTSGESIYNITSGYDSLSRYDVDGCDFFESYQAFKLASERARKGKGPSVIISDVVRLLPHSSSDDHAKYRSTKELNDDKKRDPLILFKNECMKNKIINEAKDSANTEAEKILSLAKEQITNEKMKAITELKNSVADLSIDMATMVIKSELKDKNKQ